MKPTKSVPGSSLKMIQKIAQIKVDSVILDLEDAVAPNKKEEARHLVLDYLNQSRTSNTEQAVRINSIGSGLEVGDLQMVLQGKNLDTIVIPKVESSEHLAFVGTMIDCICPERRNEIKLVALIESANALVNIKEISAAEKGRLSALGVWKLLKKKNNRKLISNYTLFFIFYFLKKKKT